MHPRYAPLLFGFLVSGTMSLMVSGIATLRAAGHVDGFVGLWMSAWIPSWMVAFPTILVVGPIMRRFVARMTRTASEIESG